MNKHYRSSIDDNKTFYCRNCLSSILPFQVIGNDEFKQTLGDPIQKKILHYNNLDSDLTLPNFQPCKYYFFGDFKNLFTNQTSYKNELNILHVNIVSYRKNFHTKLQQLLVSLDKLPDIIAMTETRLKIYHSDIPLLPDYTMIRDDSNLSAGGVALLIKNSFISNANACPELNMKVKNTEEIWLEIKLNEKETIIIAVIYRHPGYSYNEFQDAFLKSIDQINKINKNFYIFGDFNIDLLKYNSNSATKFYVDSLTSNNCRSVIDKPTRITETSATLLDHIYTNDVSNNISSGIAVTDVSDHFPTFICVKTDKINQSFEKVQIRDTMRLKETGFLNELSRNLPHLKNIDEDGTTNKNELFANFEKIFLETIDHHAPLRYMTRKEKDKFKKPWMSNAIFNSIKTKHYLYTKAIKTKNPSIMIQYKNYRNFLNRIIVKAKKSYNKSLILNATNKSKAIWAIINSITNKRKKKSSDKIKKIKSSTNDTITDPTKIANTFNSYFSKIGKDMASKIPHVQHKIFGASVPFSFSLFDTDETEVDVIIKCMKTNKASRDTNIPTKFLKIASSVVSPVLSKIFNLCTKNGVYPDSMKVAKVIPIHKKDAKDVCSNYRPISLLSKFNYIFEKLIHKRLYGYLKKFSILSPDQYGFQKNRSTAMAIYDVIENQIKNKDIGKYTCAIYLDLSKAFDTVDFKILLKKLYHYGIRGTPLKFFENYLTNRKQFTFTNGEKSDLVLIEIGVPQGSVLGPLLFLLYMNDLPLASNFVTKLFADDTCLILHASTVKELQILINRELSNIYKWLQSNKLSLNYSKTKFMFIHKYKTMPAMNIYINDTKIEQVKEIKYLGIKIDQKLNWKEHIKTLETKLSQACGAICKMRHYVDRDCLRAFYFGNVYSHLQYAVLAWGLNTKTNL